MEIEKLRIGFRVTRKERLRNYDETWLRSVHVVWDEVIIRLVSEGQEEKKHADV